MDVHNFISLCQTTAAIPYDSSKARHHFETEANGVQRCISDKPIKSDLVKALSAQDGEDKISRSDVNAMSRGLKYALIVENNNDAKFAIDVLATLNGLMGSAIDHYRSFDHPEWKRAIGLLKGYVDVDKSLLDAACLFADKEIDRAKTAVSLRKYGVDVSVDGTDLKFGNLERAYSELESKIEKFGGRDFIESLLGTLHFKDEFGRFVLPRKGNSMSVSGVHEPEVPFNYLLNLGLKYLRADGDPDFRSIKNFNEIVGLAKDICFATFSVEAYSFWDNIFLGSKNPMEYITDLILQESVFSLHQSSLRFVIPLVCFICNNYKGVIDAVNPHFTLDEYYWVINKLAYMGEKGKFKTVSFKALKNSHIRESALSHIIEGISQPIADYNRDFAYPTDYSNVNFWNYPVARIDKDKLLLFPQSIMACGWYEGLINLIRPVYKDIDKGLGTTIEDYLKHLLGKSGISCVSGKYTLPDKSKGECDGLIESSDRIVLIEVKKKSLIRDSRAGVDFKILTNLIDVIKSQVQSLKTSYGLWNDSPFKLTPDGDGVHEIELKGREIERVTLTLLPYGSIEDRAIFQHVIKILLRYQFELVTGSQPSGQIDENKIRESLKTLEKQCDNLDKYLKLSPEKKPLFNNWFLDFEQLQYLISNSNGPDEFVKKLLDGKYMTAGTLDFYNERMFINHFG